MLSSSHLVRATRGPGGGIFVESTPNEGLSRNLSDSIATMLETGSVSLHELVDTRLFLEVPLAGLAAVHATDETAAELESAIAEAEGNPPESEAFRFADTRFHRVIATTAGNELMSAFTSWVLDVLQPSLIAAIGTRIDGDADPRAASRDPAGDPPRPGHRCGAGDGATYFLHARGAGRSRRMKVAFMREYHQPLELVDAAGARAGAAARRSRAHRRRRACAQPTSTPSKA